MDGRLTLMASVPVVGALMCVIGLSLGCRGSFVSSAAEQSVSITGKTMGTSYSVKCWADDADAPLDALSGKIDRLLKNINQQMSTYLPDSELSKFNKSVASDWFAVSPETAFVVERALHYHKITDGASDVTVGPLVRLWDFGPGSNAIGSKLALPSEESLRLALANSGADQVEVRTNPPALRKLNPEIEVDLSSIAKGYAVDVIAELLIEQGFLNFMVEIGGEVRAAGTRTDAKPWRIGVERPDLKMRKVHAIVELNDQSLATSGDYRNFREYENQLVSHIIDPETGKPLPYRGWSVTLLTPTCLEADALATALLVMGEEVGYDWCEKNNVAALFLIKQGDQIVEKRTSTFPNILTLENQISKK